MNNKDLYQKKRDCCGCEVCAISCPKHIISMRCDEEGFLYPSIDDENSCINCGRCLSVCPVKSPGRISQTIKESFGGYSLKQEDLKNSASGGYATAISQKFIDSGGVVYGVRYSEDFKEAVFTRVSQLDDAERLRTSKYAQARKGSIYADVLSDLKNGNKVLFIGLPCELSAVYHYVGNYSDNLYTISLICHGPTSPKVHKDFCSYLEKKYNSTISCFSLRYKLKGWKPYYIKADFINGRNYLKRFDKTTYGMAFQYLKRPSCHVCKYKSKNKDFGLISDLIVGDYHTARPGMSHYNSWGVSQASALTEKGEYLIGLISECCTLDKIPMEIILNSNIALHQPVSPKKGRKKFANAYSSHSLTYACRIPSIYIPYKRRQITKAIKKQLFPVVRRVKHLFRHG